MKNRTTWFLKASLALVSLFCVVVFSVLTAQTRAMGAQAITDLGVLYMSGMSEQIATHFGTTIELRLSQVGALVDSAPPERYDGAAAARVALTRSARSRGFSYLAFCSSFGEFDMIYGSHIQPGMPEAFLASLQRGEAQVGAGIDAEGGSIVMMGVPAPYRMEDGSSSLALVAALPTSYLSDTLALNVDRSLVDYLIIRRDGSILLDSGRPEDGTNYFDRVARTYQRAAGKEPEQYIAELTAAMDAGRDYTSEISVSGQRQNLYCTGLPNSEWYLILHMSYGALDETIASLGYLAACALILAALLLVFWRYFRLTRQQIRDLDEARQSADSARRSAERASQVKSEFLSNMSHDIRTPMNGIMGMTSVAIANLDNTAQVRSCLRKISVSSRHLLGLINDMLDMSKMGSGSLLLSAEPVSLREIVSNAGAIIQPQAQEKGQRLTMYTQNILCESLLGDNIRLTQVLLNLLGNAVKFTPEGGAIQMLLRQEDSPRGGGFVRTHLYVRDNGIGMEPEFQAKIFDAFVREDGARVQKTQGAGLGLTITKHIIDAMQGAIEVESAPGQGSEFHVILDLERSHIRELELRLSPRRVLVAEGDGLVRETARELLSSIGLQAQCAATGAEALELAQARQKEGQGFQLILLDWLLAEEHRDTAAALGELGAPLVLLFDGDWEELEAQSPALGAAGCISKPLFRSSLYYGLRRFTEDRPPAEAEREEPMDFTGRRVLLAEDNELNWEIASELLSSLGLEVDWAENGLKCLEKFQSSPPDWYDAILMDLRMPEMTGFEAAAAIRGLTRPDAAGVPIIAISADAFYDDIQRCLDCGMNAHTAKPIDLGEVAALLERYLREKR